MATLLSLTDLTLFTQLSLWEKGGRGLIGEKLQKVHWVPFQPPTTLEAAHPVISADSVLSQKLLFSEVISELLKLFFRHSPCLTPVGSHLPKGLSHWRDCFKDRFQSSDFLTRQGHPCSPVPHRPPNLCCWQGPHWNSGAFQGLCYFCSPLWNILLTNSHCY